MIFKFHERSHQSGRKIKVGNVWHQAGVIVIHVRGPLAPHVGGLPVKSVRGRPKIRVLWPSPGRMLADSRMRQSVTRVMVRRSNFLRKIPLGVIKTMRIRRPFKGMARWKIILHEARWKAVEIMRMRGLVELGMLLMWRKWASEVRWPLHSKWRFPLTPTPWRLFVLVVPRRFKLVVPRRIGLVVPGCLALIIPTLISLFIPHSFMVVIPRRTMRWSLLLTPRCNRVRLVKPGRFIWRNLIVRSRAAWSTRGRVLHARPCCVVFCRTSQRQLGFTIICLRDGSGRRGRGGRCAGRLRRGR